MKILLIAGHGDGDPGACGNGYREADLTREVAAMLNDRFKGVCEATVADTKRNWYTYLGSHSYDFTPYDYVLEIHFNSGGGTGTEIYVTTSEQGTGVEAAIVRQICAATEYRNRGVKRTNFRVISRVKAQGVSAALLEVCFIDSASDMATYQKNKNELANAIVNGVAEGFGLTPTKAGAQHWAQVYYDRLEAAGFVTEDVWNEFDGVVSVPHALALLDRNCKGTWWSDEADDKIHWCQPIVISLCGKGWITNKDLFLNLIMQNCKVGAPMQIKYVLAMFDSATGGTLPAYADRKGVDHWGRNCLDSLCDKKIVTTPPPWTNFEGNCTHGLFMAMVCNAFGVGGDYYVKRR